MITFRALWLWRRAASSLVRLGHRGWLLLFRALLQLCFRKLTGRFLRFFVQPLDFRALVLGFRNTVQPVV